jgi:PAS domain S-box-containing protein
MKIQPLPYLTKWLIEVIATAIIYYGAARLGLLLAFQNTNASPVWPPSGIALAMILLLGYRIWPGIMIGAFLVNVLVFLAHKAADTGSIVAVSSFIATGNTLEAVFGALLIHRFIGSRNPLDRSQDVFMFVFIALLACLVSSIIGSITLYLAGMVHWALYGTVWFTWWIGDTAGVLVLTPFLLIWFKKPLVHWGLRFFVEKVLFLVLLFAVCQLVFGRWFPIEIVNYPLAFMLVPFIVWAGFWLGQSAVVLSTLLVSVVAVWGTIHGSGPFVGGTLNESLWYLQSFMGIITVTGLTLAAVLTERKRVEEGLRDGEERYRALYEDIPSMYFTMDSEGKVLSVNRFGAEQLGYMAEELIGKSVLNVFYEDDKKAVLEQLTTCLQNPGQAFRWEFRKVHKDGSILWVEETARAVRDIDGKIVVFVVCEDITERKRMEEELQKVHNELEIRVQERTLELAKTNETLQAEIVERKRAEEALRESKERYQSLIENAPVCIQEIDLSGHLISMNRVGLQMMGLKDESQVCGLLYLDAVAPEDRGRISTLLTGAYKGWVSDFEFRGVDERVLASSFIPLRGADGSILKLIGITQDITERKQAEKALGESLAQLSKKNRYETIISTVTRSVHKSINLQNVMENAVEAMSKDIDGMDNVGIYLVEGGEAVLKAHKGFNSQYIEHAGRIPYPKGFTWKTIIEGKPRYCPDVDEDTVIGPAGRELGTKSYLSMPIQFEGKTVGSININSLKKNAFDEEELNLLEIVAQQIEIAINNAQQTEELRKLKDELEIRIEERTTELAEANEALRVEITERKQAEETLAAERERLAVTLRSIRDGVIATNAEGQIILANLAGQKYLALLADARIGDILTHVGEWPIGELLSPPPDGKIYHEVVIKGSPDRIFEVVAQPMEAGPKVSGWVIVIRDSTEERTIHKRMVIQERLAAVGQLAAGIAHNFNNALTAVLGYSQMLLNDPNLSDSSKVRLNCIIEQGHRASLFAFQILDFSQRTISEQHPLNLLPLLKENVKLLEHIIPEHIKIIAEFPSEEYWVSADPVQIYQVLINLALNAQDAMPEGGELRIQITRMYLKPKMHPHFPQIPFEYWIRLSVSDNGTGIAPEQLPYVFEPFFTMKEVGKGSGLGLAQVHGIVKQHNGFIDVTSEVGKGTTFTIYLPAILEKIEVVTPEAPEKKAAGGQDERDDIVII